MIVRTNTEKLTSIPSELYENRKLIARLAYNDFKTKYAGSVFGVFWAFLQPVVTVLVFWFIFEHGLPAAAVQRVADVPVPFLLFLVAGFVPWFFFSEAISGGANAMISYNYLVKKVVFNISILPVVKVTASLFVHIFFMGFMLFLYMVMGQAIGVYAIQVVYYSVALYLLVLGVSFITASVVVFFRDLSAIITIGLQIWMWVTPIMWNLEATIYNPVILFILKLNPLFYIVSGYRDAMLGNRWFWERPLLTLYFWLFTVLVGLLGLRIFTKSKGYFADVL